MGIPPSVSDQRSRINEFINITSRSEAEARKALELHEWSVLAAVSALYEDPTLLQMNVSPTIDLTKNDNDDEDLRRALAESLKHSSQSAPSGGTADDDVELQRAVEASYKTVKRKSSETETQIRNGEVPVGLLNVGNTCYANALLQMFFHVLDFLQLVLEYREPPQPADMDPPSVSPTQLTIHRLHTSAVKFVAELQKLFVSLCLSKRVFVEPLNLLTAMVNDDGKPFLEIGFQQDVSEFCQQLLTMVERGMIRDSNAMDTDQRMPTLQSLFYGHQTVVYRATEEDGSDGSTTNQETFSSIILDIENLNNLYESLDKFTRSTEVESFTTHRGFHTQAHRDVMFTDLPQVLMFQLQRVKFNDKTKQAEKLNTAFTFNPTIYMDRYMQVNHDRFASLRERAGQLQQQIAAVQAELNVYLQHKVGNSGSSLPLDQLLQSVLEYSRQKVELGHAHLHSDEQLHQLQNILSVFHTSVSNHIDKLQARRQELDSQHLAVFAEYQQEEYTLSSILVHSGGASAGHYWAFVKRHAQWWRLNDDHVEEVSFDTVMLEATGGRDRTSAYCIIYQRKDSASLAPVNFDLSFHLLLERQASELAPPLLVQQALQDNLALEQNNADPQKKAKVSINPTLSMITEGDDKENYPATLISAVAPELQSVYQFVDMVVATWSKTDALQHKAAFLQSVDDPYALLLKNRLRPVAVLYAIAKDTFEQLGVPVESDGFPKNRSLYLDNLNAKLPPNAKAWFELSSEDHALLSRTQAQMSNIRRFMTGMITAKNLLQDRKYVDAALFVATALQALTDLEANQPEWARQFDVSTAHKLLKLSLDNLRAELARESYTIDMEFVTRMDQLMSLSNKLALVDLSELLQEIYGMATDVASGLTDGQALLQQLTKSFVDSSVVYNFDELYQSLPSSDKPNHLSADFEQTVQFIQNLCNVQ